VEFKDYKEYLEFGEKLKQEWYSKKCLDKIDIYLKNIEELFLLKDLFWDRIREVYKQELSSLLWDIEFVQKMENQIRIKKN